jgi:hypothetical protein
LARIQQGTDPDPAPVEEPAMPSAFHPGRRTCPGCGHEHPRFDRLVFFEFSTWNCPGCGMKLRYSWRSLILANAAVWIPLLVFSALRQQTPLAWIIFGLLFAGGWAIQPHTKQIVAADPLPVDAKGNSGTS